MSTTANINIYDGEIEPENKIVAIYNQNDGYPSGLGWDIVQYLHGKKIINGIEENDDWNNSFNGMGCLAASLIANLKTNIGGIYIVKENDDWAEYIYKIYLKDGKIYVLITTSDTIDSVILDEEINNITEETLENL